MPKNRNPFNLNASENKCLQIIMTLAMNKELFWETDSSYSDLQSFRIRQILPHFSSSNASEIVHACHTLQGKKYLEKDKTRGIFYISMQKLLDFITDDLEDIHKDLKKVYMHVMNSFYC